MNNLHTYQVQLTVADANDMQVYIAMPANIANPLPGLMLFQEAFGVNHHIKDLAHRFAALGFLVIAPELFHRTAEPGFEAAYNDFASVAPHFQALNYEAIAEDVKACWNWLSNNSNVNVEKIGCIGYCMGGRVSYIANTIVPVKAAISYYGGGIAPDLIKHIDKIHAHHLFFWGGLDAHIPSTQINEIIEGFKNAGKNYTNVIFGEAGHAFFCDARPAYHKQSAIESWAMTQSFLENKLALS